MGIMIFMFQMITKKTFTTNSHKIFMAIGLFIFPISCSCKRKQPIQPRSFPDFSKDTTRNKVADSLKYLIPILDIVFYSSIRSAHFSDSK